MNSSIRAFNLIQQWRLPCSKLPMGNTRRAAIGFMSGTEERRTDSFSSSPSPSSRNSHSSTCQITKEEKTYQSVGAFQKLPMVMPAIDILSSAQRKARNVSPTKGIANIAKRERNRAAKHLDTLMKELAVPLRIYVESFPNRKHLHPYECSLIELTFGEGNYEQVLGRVDSLRKKLTSVAKENAALCAKSSSKREAGERLSEGLKKIDHVFQQGKSALDDLLHVAKTLRGMPVIDPHLPTLCLVGAANVGKSSLVRVLSSGKPEVCNYPFTTRGILMGHIILINERFQVTDTPGLLPRKEEERNNIEKLTLAVLSHLPTAVLYVHDLSGDCGTSPDNQYTTYREIKEKYGDKLWLDVISKCDILEESSSYKSSFNEEYQKIGPDDAIRVSVTTGEGLDKLKARVHELLLSQMARVDPMEGTKEKL
ncbi:hypothetical protein LUZ60_006517 [Juncus effusus]|nr:hypothetical protein LUZ60_006517 [Juncus effusus]